MEMRQIRYFLAVAEHLNFRRAAEALGLSQPALSLQIQALEDEIGVRLLKRDRQSTTLTHAGETFRGDVVELLTRADRAAEQVRRTTMGSTDFLRVGFISTATTSRFLPGLISAFREAHPHIELTLQNLVSTDQIARLEQARLDIGFLRLPINASERLELIPIHREPHLLLLAEGNPLAKQKTIRPRDLRDHKLVMYARRNAPGYHDFLMRSLNGHGLNPIVAQEVGEMYTLVALVAAGIGVAIAPTSSQNYHLAGVVFRQVSWLPAAEIAIGFERDNLRAACRIFIDMARRIADSGTG